MPIIPVTSSDWNDMALVVARLFLNPSDLEATSAIDREMRAKAIGVVVEMFGSENIPLTTDEVLSLRDAHPDTPPVISANLTNLRDAFIAGQILVKALRLAKHLPARASVANAIKIVSYGFRKGPHRLGRSAMLSIWGRFKRVSHLSGAFFASGKTLRPMTTLIQILNNLPETEVVRPERKYTPKEKKALASFYEVFIFKPFEDALIQSYPHLFAAAEALRAHGENHYAHGQKIRGLPLLDPAIMWAVPNTFKLPKAVIDYGPPITDLEKRIILKSN